MSTKLTITLVTGNACFDGIEGYETARILRVLADRIEPYESVANITVPRLEDANGNKVGTVTVEPC